MRYKMFALILALTVATWAQTSTQVSPAAPEQSTAPAAKEKCACCDKMAATDSKDAHSCCAHHDMKADSGKDAMSCMKSASDKTAASCCKDGCSKDSCAKDKTASACCAGKCGKAGEKGCCSGMKSDKTAKSCCAKEMHS
jgi:hypothetical protein